MTKKANRIMVDTYNACKHNIKTFGYDGVGFTRMGFASYEIVYKRTMNEMKEILKKWRHDSEMDHRFGIINDSEYNLECQVYDMIEKTMENQYIS